MEEKESQLDKLLRESLGSRTEAGDFGRNPGNHGSRKDRRNRGRWRRKNILLVGLVAFLTVLALGTGLWLYADNSWRITSQHNYNASKAAIVDQLSDTIPDPAFIENTTSMLHSAGYVIDYIPPANVTVGFFRDLPLKGYGLVILRAHSGASTIYTTESYSASKYVYEQLADQLVSVLVNNKVYFAITENFVRDNMRGEFNGALVIAMGCSGMAGTVMAQAFLDRGASAFVGWDRSVSAGQTDSGVSILLQQLTEGHTLRESIDLTSKNTSQSEFNSAQLEYYDASIEPRQQTDHSLMGLATFVLIIVVVTIGPLTVILIPKSLGKI